MIGKITTGSNFSGLFSYLLKEEKRPHVVDGDYVLVEDDPLEIGEQFTAIAQTRPSTRKPVKHISISFAPGDGIINDEQKSAIANSIVKELGYSNNQWLAIAHHKDDPGHDWEHNHDHLHIAINMIDLDGQRVSDSFDKRRLEKILRGLEIEHNLTQIQSSSEVQKLRIASNQVRRFRREHREYTIGKTNAAPQLPTMVKLQAAVDVSCADAPTMTTFIGRLQQAGIDVRPYITDKGRKRISYELDGLKVRGSKLHNASFPKLIAARKIDFDWIRDSGAMAAACAGELVEIEKSQKIDWYLMDLSTYLPDRLAAEVENKQHQAQVSKKIALLELRSRGISSASLPPASDLAQSQLLNSQVQTIAFALHRFLSEHQLDYFEGKNYWTCYRDQKLELWHKDDRRCLFEANYNPQNQSWNIEQPINFTTADWNRLQIFCDLLSKNQAKNQTFQTSSFNDIER